MLYIIATPIGNLEDLTFRAVKSLNDADFIICEDTRVSGNLLKHYNISKQLVSLNAFNESTRIEQIISRLQSGEKAALISDAGTPLISDPGSRLIAAIRKNGITVVPVPGPSSLTAALSVTGFAIDEFLFLGFLPIKKGRQKALRRIEEYESSAVIFESVHRISKLLTEVNELMPDRIMLVCRELTKKFEEIIEGKASELIKHFSENAPRGEFVIIFAPKNWRRDL